MRKSIDTLWDTTRQRFVTAKTEEKVRQTFINYLKHKGCPSHAICVEYRVGAGRFDIAVCAPDGSLWLLAECKSSSSLSIQKWTEAYTQLRRYQQSLPKARYFAIITAKNFWWWETASGRLLSEIPTYPE
ncbi:MAG: type I restriction enzyme HsdR N-terminal domain-containing protein [Bacteroidia bacterium]|nr:type I restriction enzyme HsdR N-terminal domain-containing protein [Bacteroidia bacterium]MDW8134166.1 type I restriction enzyme HsdR N-terminal domain-containing protein [Bacteroidia bacterium]